MTTQALRNTIGFTCVLAGALTAVAETTVLAGGTTTLNAELVTTGIQFTGNTSSDIVAPLGAKTLADAIPTSEFSDLYGVSLRSPNGLPGVVDGSALTGGAVGKISTGLTDLVFDTVGSCVSGTREYSAETILPTDKSAVTYWKNRKLADIKSVTAIIQYGDREFLARTCFFENDGTTATMQFQSRMSNQCTTGGARQFLMCVRVTLTQNGEDIKAAVSDGSGYADTKAGTANLAGECIDFMNSGITKTTTSYKVRCLLAGEAGTDGGKGVEVKAAGFETVCDASTVLSRDVADPVTYWTNLKLDDIVAMRAVTKEAKNIWSPAYGYFMERKDADTLHVTFQRLAGDFDNGKDFVVSTTIEFKQVGNDVTARGVSSGYRYLYVEEEKHRPGECGMPVPLDKLSSLTYPTREITVVTKPKVDLGGRIDVAGGIKLAGGGTLQVSAPASGFSAITGSGNVWYHSDYTWKPAISNTFYGVAQNGYDGVTIFDGGYHVVAKTGALPENNTVILDNKATLVARSPESAEADRRLCVNGDVYVSEGSLLELADNNGGNLDKLNSVNLLGGKMKVNGKQYYVNYLTLADGAVVTSTAVDGLFLGHGHAYPWVFSVGSQTNRIDSGIRFYRSKGDSNQFVTFFTAADLILSAALKSNAAGYEARLIRKRGTGKLILASTCYNGNSATDASGAVTACVEVVEGALRNESANALRAVSSVELHGGTAYESVGAAQTVGRLVVDAKRDWETTDAAVRFVDGGTLSLPEGGLEIAAGARLVLDGDLAETSFRVGTSASLPNEQLRRVKVLKNGKLHSVIQNEAGYLVLSVGFTLIVR